jgi:hypothetical protein
MRSPRLASPFPPGAQEGYGVRIGNLMPQTLDSGRVSGYSKVAMDAMAARHQYWFAYYFSPPALLVGREVLSG